MSSDDKSSLRSEMWDCLDKQDLIREDKTCKDRIPNFKGASQAAHNLRRTSEWKSAHTIFCSPDSAQKEVRECALSDEKILVMASPRLKKGYLLIDPSPVGGKEREASTIKGAFKFGRTLHRFPKIDLVVEGSVAVDIWGNRLGKGGGYGDREIHELLSAGAINQETSLLSTLHEVQLVDHVPIEPHDQKINIVVTPSKIIRMNRITTI